MIRTLRLFPAAVAVAAVAACNSTDADVERALDPLNVIDETNLAEIMLSAAAPNEAVDYFRRAANEDPSRIDLQRGLATSLVRAGRAAESLTVWQTVIAHDGAMDQDRVDYADALIRTGDWTGAQAQLDATPPTFETYERYRLEAMIADSEEDWARSDKPLQPTTLATPFGHPLQ